MTHNRVANAPTIMTSAVRKRLIPPTGKIRDTAKDSAKVKGKNRNKNKAARKSRQKNR